MVDVKCLHKPCPLPVPPSLVSCYLPKPHSNSAVFWLPSWRFCTASPPDISYLIILFTFVLFSLLPVGLSLGALFYTYGDSWWYLYLHVFVPCTYLEVIARKSYTCKNNWLSFSLVALYSIYDVRGFSSFLPLTKLSKMADVPDRWSHRRKGEKEGIRAVV